MKTNFLLTSLITTVFFVSLVSFLSYPAPGIVEDVLNYTNKFRKSRGLSALIINKDLNAIAQKHSENMAKGRVGFDHSGFNKRSDEARKKIKDFKTFAENVAYGANSGREVVTMWKNSAGHRGNMLGNFRYTGIGTATNRRGVIYYTQVFAN